MNGLRWAFALTLALTLLPSRGHAFTTRIHIVIANDVRVALIESGDGTIQLRWSEHAVRIPPQDAEAIINQPLAFRAGAIGPDNVVFPAMTDGTHGVEQDPYRQCELLYLEAITEVERAYALGCFLHGATDAVAHHFVNAFTGETFTLAPITASRGPSWDNVVGHMVTESVIQGAVHAAEPSRFASGQLQHSVPHDFVLRTYFSTRSPVWQQMAAHSLERWEVLRAADPEGTVLTWARGAGYGAWEQIAMAPVYIDELQRLRASLRTWVLAEITDMSDPSTERGMRLRIEPGPDAMRGTPDDVRGSGTCSVTSPSCAELVARYYVFVNVLAPRRDAGGRELPSAFDTLSDGLGDQLYGFLPALVRVIDNLSAVLNAPIPAGDTTDHGFDLRPAEITGLFMPLTDWVNGLVRTTDAGFDGLADAITPAWYRDLSAFLRSLSIDITVGSILRALFGPILADIRDALVREVRERAEAYVRELASEYASGRDGWRASVAGRLAESAPSGLGGHALDHALSSGLYAYAFNLTAAAFANHEVVLVSGDPIASGPTSFDASYTPDWTQAGACDYLRAAVFPEGLGLAPLLSAERDGVVLRATSEDSPVECHAGSLSAFGPPSRVSCAHTRMQDLLLDPNGSLSRAYPPLHASGDPGCRRLVVPGLPDPPPLGSDGGVPGLDGGVVVHPDGSTPLPGIDGGSGGEPSDGGCGCRATGSAPPRGWLFALAVLGALAWRRRRRLRAPLAAFGVLAALAGCDGGPVDPPGTDAGGSDAGTPPMMDGGVTPMDDASMPPMMDAGADAAAPPMDAGPDPRRVLLDALAGSVWSAQLPRDEGGRAVTRAYEMRFESRDLQWAEIRNPFGPSRQRILRSFAPRADGLTVDSTIMIPAGWETPEPLRGRRETWEIEIIEGDPRILRLRNATTGIAEELAEGAWPVPDDGLTAELRVFATGGAVDEAYCACGTFCSFDRGVLWDFARGASLELPLGEDVAGGVRPAQWLDTSGRDAFAVTDVPGFDRLGATTLSAQSNFVVRYHGTLRHPGGDVWFRERDTGGTASVNGGLWAWIGPGVGTTTSTGLWFESHWAATSDWTPDEVSASFPAGDVAIEIVMVRCRDRELSGRRDITPQMRFGSGAFLDTATIDRFRPDLDPALFPPAL
ncbi:MAG: MYXO-CTERM sorting domain-containing protein [Sandaracinaceae bacterium]|nr:MYXO-CTERM sorting domain-containing protein [Sandaracinaceae bacterium]